VSNDLEPHDSGRSGPGEFDSTRWSVVLAAGQTSSPGAQEALATLCRVYWYPLYAYVRRRVADVHEAQDLIQEFFARLLEKNVLAAADPQRGRFRAFLLVSLRNFLLNEWAKAKTAKRGGMCDRLSIDLESAESRFLGDLADYLTPERLYERRWVETLLDRVTTRLQEDYVRTGKARLFEQLKVFLTGRNEAVSYAEAARKLGISEGAAMLAAHRLRCRFRARLLDEITQTLADPKDLDDEIRRLFAALETD